jgi:competence protein ComK
MKIVTNYIINEEAAILTTEFDSKGNEYSRVIDGAETFIVERRPFELLNDSIKHYGYDIMGAFKGTRSILGNINMPPINVNPRKEMIWFPCSSPADRQCVWVAHAHVVRREKIDAKRTLIHFKHGHSMIIELSTYRFDQKMKKAAELHIYLIESNNDKFLERSNCGFEIVKDPCGNNYRVNRKKK